MVDIARDARWGRIMEGAGEDTYLLLVRAASPRALEGLLQEIRARANVATRTTVVLQTFFEHRPPAPPVTAVTGAPIRPVERDA